MKSLEVITQQNRTSPSVTTKPTYKEYQKFLSTYNESKSDQQPESPIALSTNSSSSSVPSMISETDSVPVAFADYLQNYGNKKYSTVRPNLPKKNVKTEIFIQVNEEGDKEALFGRKFNTLKSRKPPGKVILARQNSLNKCDSNNWKGPLSPAGHQVSLSPPPPKQLIVPDEMIYAKTALLSELNSRPPKLNKSPSPTFKSTIEVVTAPPTSVPSLPPPPPKLPDFTSKPPPISASVSKVTPAVTAPSPKFTQPRPSFISEMQSRFNENSQNPLPGRLSMNGTNQTAGKKSPPLLMTANLPPKLFAQLSKSSEHEVDSVGVAQNGINGKKSPPLVNWNSDIPPPPPKFPPPSLKTINLEIKPVITTQTVQTNGSPNGRKLSPMSNTSLPSPPKFLAQHSKTLEMEGSTTTYVPVADTSANVDKSDPNVKKLVYNTYRGLLGAYNNRANNMVTMPRNRVVQDQGIAKQLESIESQGPTGPPGVTRLASDRRVEPPLVVQNAMLTKDKKPFTYTPGGIDLSEIRSPRMARRIERNANAPGVGDMPRTSPPRGPIGPLPPSAIAAMQPALPVQVFPSAPPPPPPQPVNIPPPPPPMEPLPTKSIATNEGIFERPDMTKIIPENPMALLRKTGGVNRRSYVEEPAYAEVRPHMNNQENYVSPQISMPEQQVRPAVVQHQVAPPVQQSPQPQMQTQPQFMQPKPQMAASPRKEAYQEPSQELKTSTAQLGSLYIPPLNNENQKTASTPPGAKVISPPTPPQRSPQSPSQSPGSPQSPMATLHRAPRPWQNQKPPSTEVPVWAQRSQSPPQAEEPQQQSQQSTPINQPTTPVNYQQRVPQSPAVQQNLANQQTQQRVPQSTGWPANQQQQRMQQQQQPNVQPNVTGRVIIPVQMDAPPQNQNVEAVYITQPIVLQHPGSGSDGNQQKLKQQQQQQYQQQQRQQQLQQQQQQQQRMQMQNQQQIQKSESKGVRIIPIQIEASATNNNVQRQDSNASSNPSSATPGSARTFVRQPSWSQSGPTQSNSFKLLQKITNTDGDDDENEESTEHGPRTSQQFEQAPADQIRKMKLSEDDQQFMNKLKQEIYSRDEENPRYRGGHIPSRVFRILDASGVDEENFLHNEVDPRYRGATIPSKAFKFLQSMTDSSNQPISSVPRNNQAGNQGPNVRTIPVQMEGEATGKPYIPPSEQTVQEPKKYTGGKIPSRSFKVLQAMTGETCADGNQATDSIENCPQPTDPSYYYGFNANYPHPPPPPAPYWPNYWPPYFYSPCPTPTNELSKKDSTEKPPGSARNTPLPFQKPPRKVKDTSESESEYEKKVMTNPRSTPLQFRGCSPQKPLRKPPKDSESDSETDKKVNLNFRSQTPLSFRGCSPQISHRRAGNKDSSSDSEHEKKPNATARSTPLPFRGSSPQASSRRQSRDHEFDHMEGARRSTSAPRSTSASRSTPASLPQYWGCYSPFYPLPYQDCDREVEQIKNNSDNSKTNPRNTPLPFWGCYSPFYPIPYQNESDIEAEQTRSSQSQDTDSEDPNYTPYPYWDPYNYHPYYYSYPHMYPYPIYPSVPCDSEESMNYSSTDEMALYNQIYEQNPVQIEDVNSETPDDSTPTPEKCQNFDEILNKFEEKCRKEQEINVSEKKRSIQEDMIQIPEEKCNNFQELCKAFEDNCYVEDNRNFLNQHLNEKSKKLEEPCTIITKENLMKHNEKYSDVDTETETETETDTRANSSDSDYSDTETEVEGGANSSTNKYSNSYGSLQAIKSVSDINIYSVDIPSSCDEEDNVSEATTTEENDDASEYMGDEAIPHQLSTIYEESERSYCSRIGRHTRESSVATTVSLETVTAGNERESDRESDETCINGTVYLDENDEINAEIHIKNNSNEKIDVDTTFTMDQKMEAEPYRLKSRLENVSSARSDSAVHDGGGPSETVAMDESNSKKAETLHTDIVSVEDNDYNKNSVLEEQPENIEIENIDIQEINNNKEEEDENQNQEDDDDGPDFWSEINKDRDDDMSYRRNVFKYRNDDYDTNYDNNIVEDENTITEENGKEDANDQNHLRENTISKSEKLILEEIQTETELDESEPNEIEQLDSTSEELKIADESSVKETQKFAVIHNEDATKFVSESHTDTIHATVTEGENTRTTTTTNSKINSFNNELMLDQNILTKEELVNGVIKSSRVEAAVCKDVSEVNKDKITNNFVTENKEQINQIYTVETKNGDIVSEKMTEDNFVRSGKSITSINGDNETTSSEIVHQNSQEMIFNEEGSKKHSSKELQTQQMLCNGIVESTTSLIENLESFNKLSKQYYLANNQYKTEEVKQNISSNKVVENSVQDNIIARQEKEEVVKKESNKSTIETANGYKEIRHKKITKKSKQYSIISSEYESDIESPKLIKNKRMEIKQNTEDTNKNKESSPNQQLRQERNEIKPKIKPEIKKANQEVISDDFEVCDECSTNSDVQNTVCSQDSQQEYQPQDQSAENEAEVKMPSIKERIEALQRASQAKLKERNDNDTPVNIKERISVIEDAQSQAKTLKEQSSKSRRSLEDISEDDIDSGVTSDISRHLSDNESDFPELRKMTRYQRASTHSRLFKLLQDECENEDNEEEDKMEQTVIVNSVIEDVGTKESMQSRRESLTLPLKNYSESDSFSSSGINSPGSPVVSERLVSELVQSLLRRKKGQIFRGMSMDKLHAAAFRILQEELEGAQMSPPSNFLSPLRNSTGDSTPAQTPQEFYSNYPEYNQYYDSWNEAHLSYENNYDILPSRAFKMIHDHAIVNKSGGISGYLARCPRVLSGRNKDLIYLSENRPTSQSSEHSLETNGATSAS